MTTKAVTIEWGRAWAAVQDGVRDIKEHSGFFLQKCQRRFHEVLHGDIKISFEELSGGLFDDLNEIIRFSGNMHWRLHIWRQEACVDTSERKLEFEYWLNGWKNDLKNGIFNLNAETWSESTKEVFVEIQEKVEEACHLGDKISLLAHGQICECYKRDIDEIIQKCQKERRTEHVHFIVAQPIIASLDEWYSCLYAIMTRKGAIELLSISEDKVLEIEYWLRNLHSRFVNEREQSQNKETLHDMDAAIQKISQQGKNLLSIMNLFIDKKQKFSA